MNRTTFEIPKMDCPSEEQLVRMVLEKGNDIQGFQMDLKTRRVVVTHQGQAEEILRLLSPLNFGTKIINTETLKDDVIPSSEDSAAMPGEARVLKQLLAINAAMFMIELVFGWFAESAGLIADSLDMFADAAVYGVSLYAVGKAVSLKHRAARMSGIVQLLLAIGAFGEVIRRFFFGSEPEPPLMMGVAFLALVANVSCLLLLSRHREGQVHMKASWIFSTNDVIANIGVIVAGGLVLLTQSNVPDLVIGTVIAFIVLRGAFKILRLSAKI